MQFEGGVLGVLQVAQDFPGVVAVLGVAGLVLGEERGLEPHCQLGLHELARFREHTEEQLLDLVADFIVCGVELVHNIGAFLLGD